MPRSKRLPRLGETLAAEADYTTSSEQDLAHTAELSLARMERAVLIPLDRLQGMPHQPRRTLREDEALHDLARSIAAAGLLQPLVAAPNRDKPGYFILIAGHRRLAAAGLLTRQEVELPLSEEEETDEDTARRRQKEARAVAKERVTALPATLRDVDPDTAFALALVENLQRDDLSRRDVMDAVKRLKDHYGWSVREIERRTGRSRTDLSRLLRIAEDDEVAALVAEERLTPTAAGPLVERQHYPVRGPILEAIRSGHVSTLAEIEAALRQAHARTRSAPLSEPQEDTETRDEAVPVDAPPAVSHMGHLTITGEGRESAPITQDPEPTVVTLATGLTERTVAVSGHTRRLGGQRAFDAARAEALARDMVLLARENVRPDQASVLKLREAVAELVAYLDRYASNKR